MIRTNSNLITYLSSPISILLLILMVGGKTFGQDQNEYELYKNAYNYLNDSVVAQYKSGKEFAKDCREINKGFKVKISNDLQVAEKFIENNRAFPLCDFLQRKYDVVNCIQEIGGEGNNTIHVSDSLEVFWSDYKQKSPFEIRRIINPLLSNKKNGHMVFFSDIFKNTLLAEVKSFCLSYDEYDWYGSSKSYFFIFDEKGNIKEVYSGVVIHYN